MSMHREDLTDLVLYGEDLTAAERKTLRRLLSEDSSLADAFSRWRRMRIHIRAGLEQPVGDRSLLVCYALEEAGRGELLSGEERQALRQAGPTLERAKEVYPAFADIIRRIQKDADVFAQVWDEHYASDEKASAGRQDRQPVRQFVRQRDGARRWAWRAGAAVAITAFAFIATLIVQRDQDLTTVTTAENETRIVELEDGSVVRLLGASALSFEPADDGATFRRYARLSGRAFFQIAPGEQTFTVQTATALATVLGTEFSVDAGEDVTEIVLATGRLGVAPAAAPGTMVVLEEGEMSRVGRNALPSTPAPVDVAQELEWTGLFVFRATSAGDIASQLSRHFGLEIEVGSELQREPVTGTFEQAQGAAAILEAVASALGASVQPVPDGGYRLR